mmetsp:Transcript_102115/g.292286  ORF Transcript_102115/g.292286 Transcript_102115/m.292286 type:complete len:89 (+) Transcript_102115:504-770(+)
MDRDFESREVQQVAADTANREEAARRWTEYEQLRTQLVLKKAKFKREEIRAVEARESLRIQEGRPLPDPYYRPDFPGSSSRSIRQWQE